MLALNIVCNFPLNSFVFLVTKNWIEAHISLFLFFRCQYQ